MLKETVVTKTQKSEIVLGSTGYYGRCDHGCPWVGSYRQYKTTAISDAEMHDDDPRYASWHNAPTS